MTNITVGADTIFVQVGSEESVFEALLAWVQYSPSAREEYLPRLLQYVRLPLLSAKYITDVVDSKVTSCTILLQSFFEHLFFYFLSHDSFIIIWL